MRDLLEFLLKKIVKNSAAVVVTESESEGWVTLHIKVDPSETGWVIGKGGRTIKSLRNIVRILAIKEGKRVDLKLENDEAAIPQ